MKRPTPKKLSLARTTIRVLASSEIKAAAGGIPPMMAPTEVTRCYDCPPP